MRLRRYLLCALVFISVALLRPAAAIDFFYEPDTTFAALGDTVLLSARIGPTDTLRGFDMYIYNDTTRIDLVPPVVVGQLLAGRPGLQFDYFDHRPNAPQWLEIGATIFGTSYWAGPGELFQARFVLRACGSAPMPADLGFFHPDGSYIPGNYDPPEIFACAAVPQSASALVIAPIEPLSVLLRWLPVTQDTSGNPLPAPPTYTVVRQQIQPTLDPPVNVATVPDTFYTDPQGPGVQYIYYIITEL